MGDSTGQPAARTSGLVVKTLGDEVLVYDLDTHRAHRLNRIAAAVWRACDGARGSGEIATALRAAGQPQPEAAVQYALAALSRAGLLTPAIPLPRMTRREVMQRLGTAAAAALPVVTTIIAPTAAQAQSAQAQSCVGGGSPCTSDAQCCSGTCIPGANNIPGACLCDPPGSPCTSDAQCCSGTCIPGANNIPGACAGA